MAKHKPLQPEDIGQALGLVVHDLRNPAATISANVDFLQEVEIADTDAGEALDDLKLAVGELRRGLDLIAWVSRSWMGQAPLEAVKGDVGVFVKRLEREDNEVKVNVHVHEGHDVYGRGAQAAADVLHIFLKNTRTFAPEAKAEIHVFREDDHVFVEHRDNGPALAPELRKAAFTIEGQRSLKGRADGRYSRFVGLFAASLAIQGVGGKVEADGVDGAAVFRIRLKSAPPSVPPKV